MSEVDGNFSSAQLKEYVISYEDNAYRFYLTDLPEEENELGGIGFCGDINEAGTCPTPEDAEKVIKFIKESTYGNFEGYHFAEKHLAANTTPHHITN
jgi:hypothetical protein